MLSDHNNPLLMASHEPTADLTQFASPDITRRPLNTHKRDLRDVRRAKSAADAIGNLDHETEIYGFTKGQFSVIDVISHCLDCIGPARLDICTWTAGRVTIGKILELMKSGTVTDARWLVDLTFNRRAPELANSIRQTFGDNAIRVAKNHAKFVLLGNDSWKVVIRTSMNLNFNPRFENFQLADDPELYDFHTKIFDEVWSKQARTIQDTPSAYMVHRHFNEEL